MFRLVIPTLVLLSFAEALQQTCVSGTAGFMCGGRKCQDEGNFCNQEADPPRCECTTGVGYGNLMCGSEDDQITSIISDPVSHTYGDEKSEVLIPCQYMLTHFKSTFTLPNGNQASCDVKVHVANRRIGGRQFPSNMKVEIQTEGLWQDKNLVYDVDGEASNGEYCFWRNLKINNANSNSFSSAMVGTSAVSFEVDDNTNRVRLQAPSCGFSAVFRPADDQKGINQTMLPGVVVKLSGDYSFEFKSQNEVVGLTPGQTLAGISPEDRSAVDEIARRALMSSSPQDQKWKSGKCNSINRFLEDCSTEAEVTDALDMCRFALKIRPFVNCYSTAFGGPNSQQILTFYEKCLQSRCQQSSSKCNWVKSRMDQYQACKSILEEQDPPVEYLSDDCFNQF